MYYDTKITLIGAGESSNDEDGNQIISDVKSEAFCGLLSIGRQEFFSAAQAGLKPEIEIEMWPEDYHGEKQVTFYGLADKVYDIYRTYKNPKTGKLEVYLTLKGGNQ